MNKLDKLDLAILNELQRDSSLSVASLSERVGLSTTPCWKRLKRLEEDGIIESRVALLNRKKVGLSVTVFVSICTAHHDEKWLRQFTAAVTSLPEVVECHRMSGNVDYLLKIVTSDIDGYDHIYKEIIKTAQLTSVSSAFSMEQIKCTTALPLTLQY